MYYIIICHLHVWWEEHILNATQCFRDDIRDNFEQVGCSNETLHKNHILHLILCFLNVFYVAMASWNFSPYAIICWREMCNLSCRIFHILNLDVMYRRYLDQWKPFQFGFCFLLTWRWYWETIVKNSEVIVIFTVKYKMLWFYLISWLNFCIYHLMLKILIFSLTMKWVFVS